ncbi:unnamed protein product [Effrenium voratum]|nr:unnamed protein product [Effrenium voratum]
MAVMPQVARHEEGDSFFDHLSSLSAAYERARAENRQLRWELAELAELTTGETERKARTLQPEAFHCAVDELDSVEFDKDEDDPFTPSQKDPKVQGQLSNDGSKRGSAFDGRRASIDSRAKARVPHAIFGRQDEIHAAIANELEPRYDVKDFYKTSGCAQWLARHPTFENVTMIIIVIYALYMSIDADLNTASIITETHPVFIVCEQLFCLYFFLELWIRLWAAESLSQPRDLSDQYSFRPKNPGGHLNAFSLRRLQQRHHQVLAKLLDQKSIGCQASWPSSGSASASETPGLCST